MAFALLPWLVDDLYRATVHSLGMVPLAVMKRGGRGLNRSMYNLKLYVNYIVFTHLRCIRRVQSFPEAVNEICIPKCLRTF